jgi:hypothetical protein
MLSLRPFNHLATRQVWPDLCIRHSPRGQVGVNLIPTSSIRLFRASINAQATLTDHRRQKKNDATVHIMEGPLDR